MEDREATGPPITLPDGSAAKRLPGFRRPCTSTLRHARQTFLNGLAIWGLYSPALPGSSGHQACGGYFQPITAKLENLLRVPQLISPPTCASAMRWHFGLLVVVSLWTTSDR